MREENKRYAGGMVYKLCMVGAAFCCLMGFRQLWKYEGYQERRFDEKREEDMRFLNEFKANCDSAQRYCEKANKTLEKTNKTLDEVDKNLSRANNTLDKIAKK